MSVLMACLSVWHSNPERHLSQASRERRGWAGLAARGPLWAAHFLPTRSPGACRGPGPVTGDSGQAAEKRVVPHVNQDDKQKGRSGRW